MIKIKKNKSLHILLQKSCKLIIKVKNSKYLK